MSHFESINPASGKVVWTGFAATELQLDDAIEVARAAAGEWANRAVDERIQFLKAFAEQLKLRRDALAEAISREVGKPRWESLTEVDAMIGKIPLTISAWTDRQKPSSSEVAGVRSATRYRPHGVVAVLGPFNFPGHLPNGHIVPALLAGNVVVFKPSELAPMVAERTLDCWRSAGLPGGVLQVLQGGKSVGEGLVNHPGINGVFLTGSSVAGLAMRRGLADHPEKILALEMGGNNPLIVYEAANTSAAVHHTIQSAFITAGQRCTCARRLIVPVGSDGDSFLHALVAATRKVRVGAWDAEPQPFMGPVISDLAGERLLAVQKELIEQGGKTLLEMVALGPRPAMLSPGIIDVTGISNREDTEIFGPLLQMIRVVDFDAAIAEANATRFGLSAGLLSDSREHYEKFIRTVNAGIINWNRPITGASGSLPFGGIGSSGNHRPSGYCAIDYCAYPIGSLESDRLELPAKLPPGVVV